MIKGVIFDFDGLLIDTETTWYEAYNESLLEMHNVEMDLAGYSACIGTDNSELISYFNSLLGGKADFDVIEELALQKYHEKMTNPMLREGVVEYLEEARRLNLKIGLASSSSSKWVRGYLEQLQILPYFDVIHTKDDVKNVKPDPELYLITLRDCGLQPHETIAFEDSMNGLRAAKRAGVYCVIVPNSVTRHLPFELHDDCIHSMKEKKIREIIIHLMSK